MAEVMDHSMMVFFIGVAPFCACPPSAKMVECGRREVNHMDRNEIALQITLKAMEMKLIPYTGVTTSSDQREIDLVIDFNSAQIVSFFNNVRNEI